MNSIQFISNSPIPGAGTQESPSLTADGNVAGFDSLLTPSVSGKPEALTAITPKAGSEENPVEQPPVPDRDEKLDATINDLNWLAMALVPVAVPQQAAPVFSFPSMQCPEINIPEAQPDSNEAVFVPEGLRGAETTALLPETEQADGRVQPTFPNVSSGIPAIMANAGEIQSTMPVVVAPSSPVRPKGEEKKRNEAIPGSIEKTQQPPLDVKAAKIAGDASIGDDHCAGMVPEFEDSSIAEEIHSARGMSVAMHHESMSSLRPTSPKTAPLASQDETNVVRSADVTVPHGLEARVEIHDEPHFHREDGEGGAWSSPEGAVAIPFPETQETIREPGFAATPSQPESAASTEADATTLVHHTMETVERMRSNGQSRVEVKVQLKDGQEITIQLDLQAGEFQPVFKTASVELRAALEQHWNQFMNASQDRGVRLAPAVFETSQSGLGNFHQNRERSNWEMASMLAEKDTLRPARARSTGLPGAGADSGSGALSVFA